MDLPHFECAPGTPCQFTDDTLVMHDLCSDILEQITNMPFSLYVIGVGVHLLSAPTVGELSSVRAIQIRTQDQNLIFRVWYICLKFEWLQKFTFYILDVQYHSSVTLSIIITSNSDK